MPDWILIASEAGAATSDEPMAVAGLLLGGFAAAHADQLLLRGARTSFPLLAWPFDLRRIETPLHWFEATYNAPSSLAPIQGAVRSGLERHTAVAPVVKTYLAAIHARRAPTPEERSACAEWLTSSAPGLLPYLTDDRETAQHHFAMILRRLASLMDGRIFALAAYDDGDDGVRRPADERRAMLLETFTERARMLLAHDGAPPTVDVILDDLSARGALCYRSGRDVRSFLAQAARDPARDEPAFALGEVLCSSSKTPGLIFGARFVADVLQRHLPRQDGWAGVVRMARHIGLPVEGRVAGPSGPTRPTIAAAGRARAALVEHLTAGTPIPFLRPRWKDEQARRWR